MTKFAIALSLAFSSLTYAMDPAAAGPDQKVVEQTAEAKPKPSAKERAKAVREIMGHLGWTNSTEFEETGRKMKDLLKLLVEKDFESYLWILDLNKHFSSEEFANYPDKEKKMDIFDAKILLKMRISEVVLNEKP